MTTVIKFTNQKYLENSNIHSVLKLAIITEMFPFFPFILSVGKNLEGFHKYNPNNGLIKMVKSVTLVH